MPKDFPPSLLWQDGIFETLRSEDREIIALDEHMSRLFESAHTVGLPLGYSRNQLKKLLSEEVASKPYPDAYVRITFLREGPPTPPYAKASWGSPQKPDAVGRRGTPHEPLRSVRNFRGADKGSRLFLIVKEAKRYNRTFYEKGISIRTSPTWRNPISAIDAQVKVKDYLNGLLSTLDGLLSEVAIEEIYLDSQGYVTEGRISNIFMVKGGNLFTPPPFLGVLRGITRGQVMAEAKRLEIPVHEEPFTRFNLYGADEAFLTNTSMGALPVVSVDRRMIGHGKVGGITKRMIHALLPQKGSLNA